MAGVLARKTQQLDLLCVGQKTLYGGAWLSEGLIFPLTMLEVSVTDLAGGSRVRVGRVGQRYSAPVFLDVRFVGVGMGFFESVVFSNSALDFCWMSRGESAQIRGGLKL